MSSFNQPIIEHSDGVFDAVYSPDSRYIVTASADNTGIIWDAETCQPIQQLVGHTDWVIDVDYSPDGRFIATASWDKTIKIWNADTGELVHTLKVHTDKLNSVRYSPYPDYFVNYLVSTGKDNQAIVWDTNTYDIVRIIHDSGHPMTSVDFYPDRHSQHIIIANYDNATVWDFIFGDKEYEISHESEMISQAIFSPFSPEGVFIATTGYGSQVAVIWDANTGQPVKEIDGINGGDVTNITYSPDGKWLATTTNSNPVNQDYETIIYDIESNEIVKRLWSHDDAVITAHFSPDGKNLVTASMDSTADVWDVATWKLKCTLGTPKPIDEED